VFNIQNCGLESTCYRQYVILFLCSTSSPIYLYTKYCRLSHKQHEPIITKSINLSTQYIVPLLLFVCPYSRKQQFTNMNAHLETPISSIHFAPSSSPKLFLSSLCNVTPSPGISEVLEGQFTPSLPSDGVWLFCRPCTVLSIVAGNLSEGKRENEKLKLSPCLNSQITGG
jgi:hypothetical protein